MFVIEKMRHGRRYVTPLYDAGERAAPTELAFLERDPEAYLTRTQAKDRRAAEVVHMTAEGVNRVPPRPQGSVPGVRRDLFALRRASAIQNLEAIQRGAMQ